jgi:hypothetical protein
MKITLEQISMFTILFYALLWMTTPAWAQLIVRGTEQDLINCIISVVFDLGLSVFFVQWMTDPLSLSPAETLRRIRHEQDIQPTQRR